MLLRKKVAVIRRSPSFADEVARKTQIDNDTTLSKAEKARAKSMMVREDDDDILEVADQEGTWDFETRLKIAWKARFLMIYSSFVEISLTSKSV